MELDDLLREKRLRNRETADVEGAASDIFPCGGKGAAGDEAGGGVGLKAGSEDSVTLVEDSLNGKDVTEPVADDCTLSALARGEDISVAPGGGVLTGRTEDSKSFGFASDEGARFPRRPKNDNRPPLVFFLLSVAAGSSFSIIFQPGGKRSSFKTSGLDFTKVSHAIDPFEAMYKAIGLDRIVPMCRVSRRASLIYFEVKVFENCTC